MTFCIKCGREVMHGAKFCHYCGAQVGLPKGRGLPATQAPAVKKLIRKELVAVIATVVIIGVLIATAFFVFPGIFGGSGEAPSEGGTSIPSGGGTSVNARAPLPDAPETAKGYITVNNSTVQSTLSYIITNKPLGRTDFGAIQEWINSNVTYDNDIDVHGQGEYFQYPSETITLKTGDCEDYAILFSTLLRAYGVPADSVYVVAGYGSSSGHAWVAENYRYSYWRYIEPQSSGGTWADWIAGVHVDDSAYYQYIYPYNPVYFNDQTYTTTKPFILQAEAGQPSVTSVYWEVGGQAVTTTSAGSSVQAKVVLKAEGGPISGSYQIVIRKDIAWATDEDYAQGSGSVSLSKDASQTLALSWSPIQASGGSLRGYFIEFWFDGEKIYTMDSSYPPRLTVS